MNYNDSGAVDSGMHLSFSYVSFLDFSFFYYIRFFSAKKDVVAKEAVDKNDSVILISDRSSSDDDVVFVEDSDAVDIKSDASGEKDDDQKGGYSGDVSSDLGDGSSDFGASPPDRTEYLRMLYDGKGHLIPDESLRPPPRFNSTGNIFTSTPKKNENA